MKKSLTLSIVSVVALILCLVFAGCEKEPPDADVPVVVFFNADGGVIASGDPTARYDGSTPVTAPEVLREGYVFLGWDAEFSSPEADLSVNALWDKLYTVSFDPIPGADDDDVTLSLLSSDKVEYPADPVREGYVFDGWDKLVESVGEDTVIAAKWRKLYTVTFNLNGGTTSDTELLSQIVAEGGSAIAPLAEMPYMAPASWDRELTNITSDMEVNALWERRELTGTEVAKLISPATVEVNTYRRNNIEWATGSGFFIDGEGRLVTNYHVIEDAYVIKVMLDDGTVYEVSEIVAFDEELDIAILKIDRETPHYLEFSTEPPDRGDVVYTLGSSLGLEGTFASGLVSTVSREIEGQNYIQITAAVSGGNSGGPLVNSRGYVIGINTLSATAGQNLNFAIPIARVGELKENRMGVRVWFDKYTKLKWWFMENVVSEHGTSSPSGQSIRVLNESETVRATCAGTKEEDTYYLKSARQFDENGKELPVDLYIYYYTKDKKAYKNTLFWLGTHKTSVIGVAKAVDYDYGVYTEYDGGYLVCIAIYDIFDLDIDYTTSQLCISISSKLTTAFEYYVFMMYTTNTDLRDNPY